MSGETPLPEGTPPTEPTHVPAGGAAQLFDGGVEGLARDLLAPSVDPVAKTQPLRDRASDPATDQATMKIDAAAVARTTPAPATVAKRPRIPPRLGPFVLGEELGHGGMGVVYRARHEKLGTDCAVKVLIAGEHASPELIARFQREAGAVAKMGKHPNIVGVFDLGEEAGLAYYAMELVDGRSLRQEMKAREIAPREAAVIAEKTARALHFAHEHGIIHRDMKPDNVIMRKDGEPQVMDFGLARDAGSEEHLSVTGQIMGTLAYMAPEQAAGRIDAMDARTDVYALGGVLYELLTGSPPHPGKTFAAALPMILRGDIIAPRRLRPEAPRDLETVAMKALALEPSRRYASAETMAEDLARWSRGDPILARPIGPVARLLRRVRRHPVLSSLVALIVGLGAFSGWRLAGPARITVTTQPEDARVEAIGTTLTRTGWVWPARKFRLRVSHDGCETVEVEVNASPGTVVDVGSVSLRSDHGAVKAIVDPPTAEIWVDGELVGTSDANPVIQVPNGPHRLLLRSPGFREDERLVTILAGETLELPKVTLARRQGTVRITGRPRDLTVAVCEAGSGAEVLRVSPPVEVALNAGDYVLRGHVAGHYDREYAIHVEEGSGLDVDVWLARALLWEFKADQAIDGSPLLADLDGDGRAEVILTTKFGHLYALSGGDGSLLWDYVQPPYRWPAEYDVSAWDTDHDGVLDIVLSFAKAIFVVSGRNGVCLWTLVAPADFRTPAAFGDLNGDGVDDCVVGGDDQRLRAHSTKDGSPLWSRKMQEGPTQRAALGDLTGDGTLECITGCADGAVYALNGRDGSVVWGFRAGGSLLDSPALIDVDRDGSLDCLFACSDSRVYAVSGSKGTLIWSLDTQDKMTDAPFLSHVDSSGVWEVVVALTTGRCLSISGSKGTVVSSLDFKRGMKDTVLEDLDRDGVLDCVSFAQAPRVIAYSGRSLAPLWTYECPAPLKASPCVGDLDMDGFPDCVFACDDHRVYALSGAAAGPLWSVLVPGPRLPSPSVGSLDRDGVPDCVVASENGKVYAISGRDGRGIWECDVHAELGSNPTLADLNRDGIADCIFGTSDRRVCALSGVDGSALWTREVGWVVDAPLAVRDLDGDGELDCVAAAWDGMVYCLAGGTGGVRWTSKTGGMITGAPALGDIDRDGVVDCVVNSTEDGVYALSGRDGARIWRQETDTRKGSAAVLGDLNGDGLLDCVVQSEIRLYALSGVDGSAIWIRDTSGGSPSRPFLLDTDRDGVVEGVFYMEKGGLRCLDRKGELVWGNGPGAEGSEIMPADVDGDRSPELFVSTGSTLGAYAAADGTMIWGLDVGESIIAGPSLADLDGDGVEDLLLESDSGRVFAFARTSLRGAWVPFDERRWFLRRNRLSVCVDAAERPVRTPEAMICLALDQLRTGSDLTRALDVGAALDAFAGARELGMRSPEGAVHEWIASRLYGSGDSALRQEADGVFRDALASHGEVVFDTWVSGGGSLTVIQRLEGPQFLDAARESGPVPIELTLLRALPLLDWGGGVASQGLMEDLKAARAGVLAHIGQGEGDRARWDGYLAIIAKALGEEGAYAGARAAYFDHPRRPNALDTLMQVR